MGNGTKMMLDGFSQRTYRGPTAGALDFPARTSALPESRQDSKETGAVFFSEEKDRPMYLFIENVKNLLSINGGWDFLAVLSALDESGYDAEWQVINSAGYVPQNRERVFIVGHLRGRCAREVFPVEGTDGENIILQVGKDIQSCGDCAVS